MAAAVAERASRPIRRARSRVYVGLALLIAVITLAGFAPSLYGTVVEGAVRPWFIHLHAVVYVGWLGLLIAQSVLASNGKIGLHRRVGNFGIGYGCVVLVLGIIVTFAAAVVHVEAGEWPIERGANFLTVALGDMVLFGGFFGAAIWYRQRSEIHKRLMLLATVALMFAGAGRLWFLGDPANVPLFLAIWYTPVLIGMAYDLATTRRVHPVYVVGAVIMGVWLARIPFGASAMWQDIGRRLLSSLS